MSASAPATGTTENPADVDPADGTHNRRAKTTTDTSETSAAADLSPGSTAASGRKYSLRVSTSELTKLTVRPSTPRPMVRGLNAVGERVRDLLHSRNGRHPTGKVSAVSGRDLAGRSSARSSAANSSSTGSGPSSGESSGGDASGSRPHNASLRVEPRRYALEDRRLCQVAAWAPSVRSAEAGHTAEAVGADV